MNAMMGFVLGDMNLEFLTKFMYNCWKNKTIRIQTKLNWNTTVSHYRGVRIFSKNEVYMVYISLKSKGAFKYKR